MTKIPSGLRRRLLERDGNHCRFCGERVFPKHGKNCVRPSHCLRKRTADHLVPVAQGGPTILANVVVACAGCNEAKGNQCAVGEWEPLPPPAEPLRPREYAECGCDRLVPRWERLGHTSWEALMEASRSALGERSGG